MSLPQNPPEATLLLTRECALCPAVLNALSQLVKEGELARLEVINISVRPEVALTYNVRAVPWVRIGEFELPGTRTADELRRWARMAGTRSGHTEYIAELLRGGGLDAVVTLIQSNSVWLDALIALVPDLDAEFQIRIGVGAALEHMQDSPLLAACVPTLGELARHGDARVRADACHYLGLTGNPAAIPLLESVQADPDIQVREIVADSLAMLKKS